MTRPTIGKRLKDFLMRRWYTVINRADVEGVLRFMNYGFHGDSEPVGLSPSDEPNRYPIQLYHHLASLAGIRDRDLLEVGCGRGGGISYVVRNMGPKSAHGVDLSAEAVKFCRAEYAGISFTVMDAQDLTFADGSFDVVLNVESSHRYGDFGRFVREVHRVLRPGGHFLFTDFRYSRDMEETLAEVKLAGFRSVTSETINAEVLEALRRDSVRRIGLIRSYLPAFLRPAAREFAGTPGTRLFRSLAEQTRLYACVSFVK